VPLRPPSPVADQRDVGCVRSGDTMSYLSRRMREINQEEYGRQHALFDFRTERALIAGRWRNMEDLPERRLIEVNWRGRAG
jgi:hypothetical protein